MRRGYKVQPIEVCELCDRPSKAYYFYETADIDMWICEECFMVGQQMRMELSI